MIFVSEQHLSGEEVLLNAFKFMNFM